LRSDVLIHLEQPEYVVNVQRPAATLTQFAPFIAYNAIGVHPSTTRINGPTKTEATQSQQSILWPAMPAMITDPFAGSPDNYARKSVRVLIGLLITIIRAPPVGA